LQHREEIKKIRDEFNEQRREFMAYQKQVREIRNREWLEQKAARQAYYDEERRKREEEEMKRDPWEEEKLICEQLISWVGKFLPKQEEAKDEKIAAEVPTGVRLHKAKSTLEDEEDPYASIVKRKGKGAKKGKASDSVAYKPKSMKISLAPEDYLLFEKLGFTAPQETNECSGLHKQLVEKRVWLKTAPPKPKKEAKEETKKELAAVAAPANDEPAAPPTFDEAADLKKKQEDLARKAAEAAKAEDERNRKAAELEASGKKAAGGLHKFDASEVDVHGGNATADDFMDAFGFGDGEGAADDHTDCTSALEPAPEPAAPTFDEAADLKKKQEDLARKAAEAAKAEDERNRKAAELEASGKKAAGGLHKFDASEVDVHGGNATADDFMDAFGFVSQAC